MKQIENIEDFAEMEKGQQVRIYRFGDGTHYSYKFVGYLETENLAKAFFEEQVDYMGTIELFSINSYSLLGSLIFIGDFNQEVFKEAWELKVKKWYMGLFGNNGDDSLPF